MNELTHENLVKLMQFRPTLSETANWFNVSEDTIERRIKKIEKCGFGDFRDRYSQHLKQKLRERAIELAMNGHPTMMIFCLKNLCGWGDKNPGDENEVKPFTLAYSLEGLKRASQSIDS